MTTQDILLRPAAETSESRRPVWAGDHLGRSFEGHELEDDCPCGKAPCGLVLVTEIRSDCPLHHEARSMRQSHPASRCPGKQ